VKGNQTTLREARRTISKIIASGDTVTIARPYGEVRAFIVPVPAHNNYDRKQTIRALAQAKKSFLAAWRSAHPE
jgi:antitoxin (DNA-binding transcriptional repressor) of toxin-antitoxin stability system